MKKRSPINTKRVRGRLATSREVRRFIAGIFTDGDENQINTGISVMRARMENLAALSRELAELKAERRALQSELQRYVEAFDRMEREASWVKIFRP
jgi:prefoldin subunit 5